LLALAAGETVEAQREASKARRLLGDTPQTLLLAAEAGRLAGDDTAATAAFKALTAREDASFLGYRGLLRRAMEQEDWSEAASLARSAEAAHPGAAWLRGERRQLAIRTGNWNEALALAGPDSPKAALAVAAAEADPDAGRALRTAKRAWREAPDNPAATLAFARRLRAAGKERRAQAVIRRGWTLSPQPDLAAFALSGVMAGPSRLAAAKQLVVETPTALESRMLLAREMLDAGEAVNAKAELEAARDAGADQRRLWVLLAEVEERLGAADAAGEAWRRAARASADSAWRCDSCGAEAPRWQPVCAACGKIGTLRWSAHSVGSVIIPPATSVTTVS
jgi:HemY protein